MLSSNLGKSTTLKSHAWTDSRSMNPIENSIETFWSKREMLPQSSGQSCIVDDNISIESFLMGDVKYSIGGEFNVKELFDAYNQYRDGRGVEYYIHSSPDGNKMSVYINNINNILLLYYYLGIY